MNKMKFFLSAGALIWTLFSMPFGNSCLFGSDSSVSEEEGRGDILLFKGRAGSTIPRTKLQAFLAPEFTVSLKCNVALTVPDDIDSALRKLQSLAVQFVREVSMRESDVSKRTRLFMSTFEHVNEMTVNETSCLMPLYTIGSYRVIGTVINGINNALYKKVVSEESESGTTSKEDPVYSTANNQRAFQAVKQAFGFSLLTVLHEDGEEVDDQLEVYKKMSQGLFEDEDDVSDSYSDSSDSSEDEEKSLRSMIVSRGETIIEQNETYQTSKKRYQEYLDTLASMEKIRAELPMKNHVIGLIFLSLGFEKDDVRKTMHYLLDQGEFESKTWPLFLEENPTSKSKKTKLAFKSSKDFLEKLLQIMDENPMAETPSETPYFVEEEALLEDLLCHEPEPSDSSVWLDLLSRQSKKNSKTLFDLNRTNRDLKVIAQKAVAETIGANEPLVRFFKGFYGYLGGTDVSEFMDVFVKKTKKRLVKTVQFEGVKFPKTRDKFVDGLWRFLHKDKI